MRSARPPRTSRYAPSAPPADELQHADQLQGEVDEVGLRGGRVQRHLLLGERDGLQQRVDQAQRAAHRGEPQRDGEHHQHLGAQHAAGAGVGHDSGGHGRGHVPTLPAA
ncbi:hypothetical protein GCM10017691_62220 [Pseudonocardia petroleophila]